MEEMISNTIRINQKLDSAQCWITVSSVHVSLSNYIHMTRIYSEEKVTSAFSGLSNGDAIYDVLIFKISPDSRKFG